MIPEIIRYKIPTDAAASFTQAYAEAGEVLKQSPNCRGYELIRSTKDPELFLLTIHWDSPEGHMAGFRHSPLFPRFFALIKPYLDNILEMEHYEATEVAWRAGVGKR